MNKTRLLPLALIVLAVAFVAVNLYAGHRVEREMAVLAQALAERPDVRVTRFDYERGFREGTLRYDLVIEPVADDARADALRDSGLIPRDGLQVAGTLRFHHGPWIGGGAGFGLAGSRGHIALPEQLRPMLPQYPEQAPAVELAVVMTFGGKLAGRLSVIEYSGQVISPDIEGELMVEFSGAEARVRITPQLDRLALALQLDELTLAVRDGAAGAAFQLEGLQVEAEAEEARSWIWTSSSRNGIDRLAFALPHNRIEATALAAGSDTWIEDGMLHSRSTVSAGASSFNDHALLGGEAVVSLRNLDMDALSRVAEQAERISGLVDDRQVAREVTALAPLFDDLIAGDPRLLMEPLRLGLVDDDDVLGHLRVYFADAPPLSSETLEGLARALRMEADLRVRKAALRYAAGLAAAGPLASAAEREAAADAAYRQLMSGLAAFPFVEIGEDAVSASAEVRDGVLFVGGSEVMRVDGFIVLFMARFAEQLAEVAGDGPGTGGGEDMPQAPGAEGPRVGAMDPQATPLYGRLRLQPDFRPDPQGVQVVAGGEDDLETLVGAGCVGLVNAARPDLVLSYQAGAHPLYIYASAGADTTLAVRGPRGLWHCNDDALALGFNPGLEFVDPASGDYAIWLGTYEGGAVDAVLHVSEIGMQ